MIISRKINKYFGKQRNGEVEHEKYLVHHESLFPIDIHFKITANFHYNIRKAQLKSRFLFWKLLQKEKKRKEKNFNNPIETET